MTGLQLQLLRDMVDFSAEGKVREEVDYSMQVFDLKLLNCLRGSHDSGEVSVSQRRVSRVENFLELA